MSADMTTRLGWVRDLHLLAMRTPAAFAVSCTMGLMAPAALATPDGGTFVTNPEFGQILQFGPDGQTVTNVFLPGTAIDPSNRHLINWTSLDLGAQETLNFSGADGYSVMNRITTLGSATSINGTLNAMTGNVFIVNSAGVVFGQNAVINAAGLHAAAANWSEGDQLQTDFLAGAPLTFNTTGDVEFHGILNASDGIALLGQHVQNTGEINGRYIVMAAGDRIVVEDLGSRFSVVIDGQSMDDLAGAPAAGTVIADLTTGDPAIHNSGTITTTDGGNVSLLAGDLLGLAILHDGEIHAEGGDVDLLASGGAIWTNADNVGVANAGLIDVSDDDQAGTVQMSAAAIVLEASTQANGHDGAISIQASSNVVLAGGGVVVADGGIAAADGGEILIRATDGTVWAEAGTGLSAKGGLFGGDGGRIEVSGQTIAVLAATKLGAVSGEAGQLFINSEGPLTIDASGDPLVAVDQTDLSSSILVAGATGRLGAASGETLSSVDGHLSVSSGEPLRIETSLLDLRETAILTSDEIQLAIGDAEQSIHATSLTLNGNVVLEQSVTLGSDDMLALRGGGVSGDETTALVLSSEGVVELEGDLGSADSQLGNIDVLTGHTISLLGGSTEAGQYIHTSGNLNIDGSSQGDGGAVSVNAAEAVIVRAGGDISLGVDDVSDLSVEVAGNVDIEAGGAFTNTGDFNIEGSLRFAGGDLVNNADLSAGQGITMQALTGTLDTAGALNTVMDINLAAADTLTNEMSLASEQGSVRLESYQSDVISLATLDAADIVSLKADNGMVSSMGDVQATDVMMTAGADITIGGNVTGTTTLTAASAAGDITTSGGGVLHGNSLSLDATAGSIDVTSNLSGQTISVTAANGLAIEGSVTGQPAGATGTGGDVSLTAAAGNATLSGELSGDAITMSATAGEVTYAGNASASGDLIMSGDAVTVTSGSLSGSNVLVTSTGAASITADVNATGNLIVTSVADAVSYEGAADVDGLITLNAETTVTLAGQLTGTSLSATATQGDLFQSGSVVAAGDVSLTAAAGNATLSGDVTGSSVVAAAFGDVTQAGTINSPGVVLITSEQGGTITIDGTVTAGGSLDVRAENDGVIAIGGQLTGDAVLLDASTMQLTGADVRSINGDLHILADQTIFSGNTSLESGEDLVLAASAGTGQVRIDDASVGLTAAGDVNLLSTVDGSGGMLTASAGDMLLIGGDIGATEEVESLEFTADRLVLGGPLDGVDWTVGQMNARGDIGLNAAPLDTLSDLPTVHGFGPSLAITSRQGDVQIGANHGLSYLGDVMLDAGGTLTVGDITTLGDLTLRGNTVAVYQREEGVLTEPFGPVNSEQTSIISGGTLRIEGDLQYIGDTGAAPRFAAVVDAFGVPVLQRGVTDAFDASDIVVASADGDRPALRWLLPRIDVRDDGVIAAESKLGEAVVRLPKGNEEIRTLEVLADLGIELIDSAQVGLRADQLAAASHRFINDIGHRGGSMVDPTSGLVRISRSRLNGRFVRAAVTDYAAAIEWAPEAGSMESAGQSIELARLEWQAELGEKSDYRQWLAAGGSPVRERAARILADLDAVFRDLRLAGLTRAEVAASRRYVTARLGGGEI